MGLNDEWPEEWFTVLGCHLLEHHDMGCDIGELFVDRIYISNATNPLLGLDGDLPRIMNEAR